VASTSTELAEEQAYFDRAAKYRERRRQALGEVPAAAANPGAAQRLRSWVKGKRDGGRAGTEAVAFGRIDDQARDSLYIGAELITDDYREVLVVNWQAPAAAPYYEATLDDPHGLVRKRSYVCAGNTITDFADVIFHGIAADLDRLEGPDALLLAELGRAHDGRMHEIVATIQAAQYELVRAPLDQVLVIEGGPGTGKTAVALHRVSFLLFNHRDRLSAADVLIVGPTAAFTRYVRTVLPELGDTEVAHADIGQLAPPVTRGRPEPARLRRLKGDQRMAGLLARAVQACVGAPEPAERLLFSGRFVTLAGTELQSIVDTVRAATGSYHDRRELLRDRLHELARERGAPTSPGRLEPVEALLERLWPQLSAASFLRGLLGSARRLAAAAGEAFTAAEVTLLRRRGADRLSRQTWSDADLPLLDEVEDLLHGTARRYRHIVVDEAQDLSPMQLRSIARRCPTGSMTVVGDLAQSTGPWARDGWDDLLGQLPGTLPHTVTALRYGYRVPRRVYDLAARLLPVAAPGSAPLRVVRDGPADPRIHRVEVSERPTRAASIAADHAAEGRLVGVVCPLSCRQEVAGALAAGGLPGEATAAGQPATPGAPATPGQPATPRAPGPAVVLVDPGEAKGLEFDAVIVVEPDDIVAGDERGHRLLFIALTRTTRYLDIVCVGEPLPLSVPEPPAPPVAGPAPGLDPHQVDLLARQVAAAVSGGAPTPLWDEVLDRAAAVLDRQRGAREPAGRHRRG
jgi:AAA domain/UvrD-like helicase C-terminal domain